MEKNIMLISSFVVVAVIVAIVLIIFLGTGSSGGSNNTVNTTRYGIFSSSLVGNVNSLSDRIKQAEETISSIITEDIEIPITYRSISYRDGILAQAIISNPDDVRGGGIVYLSENVNVNVIIHEIFHVLGIGSSTKWINARINNSGYYYLDKDRFPIAASKYQTLFSLDALQDIPLSDVHEHEMLSGDHGYHFAEDIFDEEIMTPIADIGSMFISSLTIGALEDMEFSVSYDLANDNF